MAQLDYDFSLKEKQRNQQSVERASRQNAKFLRRPSVRDPFELDQVYEDWGYGYDRSVAPHNYFDYFFSGQDVRVFIDGTEDEPYLSDLPIIQFGFNVSQQKAPIYGFWNYTYGEVMRGVRLVSGVFTIATKSPDYMKKVLSKSAETVAKLGRSYTYIRRSTEDDENIDRYWGKHIDDAYTTLGANLFNIHPPFTFIIVYGLQSLSLDSEYRTHKEDLLESYYGDNPLFTDINERLVDSDGSEQTNRIILPQCELQAMETSYGPDGAVITETYQFFAQDIITPARVNKTSQKTIPNL